MPILLFNFNLSVKIYRSIIDNENGKYSISSSFISLFDAYALWILYFGKVYINYRIWSYGL